MVALPISTDLRLPPRARSLLVGDALLIAIYLFFAFCVATGLREGIPWMFNIDRADAIPSWLNHGKWVVVVVSLAVAFRRSREPVHLSMAAVFTMVLIDDFFEGHERIGRAIADRFGIIGGYGLNGQSVMELLMFAVMGVLALLAISTGYRVSGPAARRQALVVIALIGVLAVCGVGFDALHAAAAELIGGATGAAVGFFAGLLEDGGEMIVGSLLAAYSVSVAMLAGRGDVR